MIKINIPTELTIKESIYFVFIQICFSIFCSSRIKIPHNIIHIITIQYVNFKYGDISYKDSREVPTKEALIFSLKNGKKISIAIHISNNPKI